MYISSDVANRIRDEARKQGITVKQLLEDAALGKNMMTMMRSSMPKADNLAKIADVLGCSVDYLLGREASPAPVTSEEGKKTEAATQTGSGHSRVSEETAAFIDTLPPDEQERVQNMIRAMYAKRKDSQ